MTTATLDLSAHALVVLAVVKIEARFSGPVLMRDLTRASGLGLAAVWLALDELAARGALRWRVIDTGVLDIELETR